MTQAYARLLAEAKRTAPPNVSPYKHAWQTSLMATCTFEAGLVPHVRLELIREDPSLTYQASRTRAKKPETSTSIRDRPLRFDHDPLREIKPFILVAFRSSCIRTRGFESHGGHQYERLDLPQRVAIEAQRSVTDASTRLGAGVEAEGVVAELASKLKGSSRS